MSMFKRTIRMLPAVLLLTGMAWAMDDPFVGDWKLNLSKSMLTDKMIVKSASANRYTFDFGGGPETITMGNMNFAAPLVRRLDAPTLQLMRKSGDGGLSDFLRLELSADGNALTITPHSVPGVEQHIFAFDRQ